MSVGNERQTLSEESKALTTLPNPQTLTFQTVWNMYATSVRKSHMEHDDALDLNCWAATKRKKTLREWLNHIPWVLGT